MLTLQECKQICTENPQFYFKEFEIDNFKITSFDYKDGTHYEDFKKHNAFELRGLTFVENKVFPMIHKFFNLGERYEGEVEECLNKEVESVQIKEDGSLITFIQLPNGKILPKTKMGFSNDQVKAAEKWLSKNRDSIQELLEQGYFPFFEYVSPDNKIVLEYEKEDFILIQVRKKDFSYCSVRELKEIANKYSFSFKDPVNYSLSELIELKSTIDNVEGFIVRFTDNTFVKVKTDWYFKEHSDNEGLSRLNELLDLYFKDCSKTGIIVHGNLKPYEHVILDIVDLFLKEGIKSKLDLKNLIFDKSSKVRGSYIALYRKFIQKYNMNNSIETDSGFISICLEGRLDDFLPKVKNQKEYLEKEKKLFSFIDNLVESIQKIVDSSETRKEIAMKFNKEYKSLSPFQKIAFEKFQNKSIDIRGKVIDYIKDNLNNKKFLKKIF